MIFYGLGVAKLFDWNFNEVKLWIIQPRIKGYRRPECWTLTMEELRAYEGQFREAVERVEKGKYLYYEGSWCHWCKARPKCPLKRAQSAERAKAIFQPIPGIEDARVFTDDSGLDELDFL